MSRLIDADKLNKKLTEKALTQRNTPLVECRELIHDAPTVDAVEVVRCKDCKRGGWRVSGLDNKTKGYRCAIHAVLGVDFGDNGYCSYGERKEK